MTVNTWGIYWVNPCGHCIPLPTDKFVVIVCVQDRAWGFLINSEINVYLQIDPIKRACQVRILKNEHPCLTHDSWVNCYDIFPFDEVELKHKREQVSATIKQAMLVAIETNPAITTKLKKTIRKSATDHEQAKRPAQP